MRRIGRETVNDIEIIIAGTASAALAIDVFMQPNHISPGGLTGVATALNFLINIPSGLLLIVMNIPLAVVAARQIGAKFLIKTVAATLLLSVLIDLFAVIIPQYEGNRILASVYGGLLNGFGLALVFLRGGTTGGTDIAAKLINRRYPYVSMGRVLLVFDAAVCIFAAVVYRDVETALYSVVAIFVSSRVLDATLYGGDRGKMFYVFSKHTDRLSEQIMRQMKRGVTVLSAHGGYSGEDRPVILCAVRNYQAAELRRIIRSCDQNAFIIIANADEILGLGFKALGQAEESGGR